MQCGDAHDELIRGVLGEYTDRTAAHLRKCPQCAELAGALERTRQAMAAQHKAFEPDSGFSARVLQRIDHHEAESWTALKWAASRLLPVAAALALTLLAWQVSLGPQMSAESLIWGSPNDDQLVAFLLTEAQP